MGRGRSEQTETKQAGRHYPSLAHPPPPRSNRDGTRKPCTPHIHTQKKKSHRDCDRATFFLPQFPICATPRFRPRGMCFLEKPVSGACAMRQSGFFPTTCLNCVRRRRSSNGIYIHATRRTCATGFEPRYEISPNFESLRVRDTVIRTFLIPSISHGHGHGSGVTPTARFSAGVERL